MMNTFMSWLNKPFEHPENRPLSILFFGTQMAIGGAQNVLLAQARWFHRHGYRVSVVFLYDKENLHEPWQSGSDFPIHNLNAFSQKKNLFINIVSLMRGLFSLWKFIQEEEINVIETFTHDSNIFALFIAYLSNIPVRIATHHGVSDSFLPLYLKIHSWLINLNIANVLVAVSEGAKQQAIKEGVQADRILVIRNGIEPVSFEGRSRHDLRKEAGLRDDEFYLLSVGRLVYQKAHTILLQAMPQVLKKFPGAKLGICGDGILRSDLQSQIKELHLIDSVFLLGKWDSVTEFLKMADLFVLPSRWEGLPIALLEAMSAGLPIVATRVEGVDEVVKHGEHGLLVSVENVDGLAEAILQLLGNSQLRSAMAMAAKAYVLEHYTEDLMCEQYLKVMKKFFPR
jgi:glycosyltransferase involved in cell wall biosynthesis